MSDFGLQVFTPSGKALNVSDASPLQFIRKISRSEVSFSSGASTSFDFSAQAPAGVQLVVWTDSASITIDSTVYLDYRIMPVSITIADRRVTLSLPEFGTGNWIPRDVPTGFWVFAVYQQPVTSDGWGLFVDAGGAFPAVVNSAAGLFMTAQYSVTFTGRLTLNCSENAMVFCNCADDGIGLFFDRTTRQIIGYKPAGKQWGTVGGFSVPLKVCVFDVKTPTIPDWGLMVYGADGGVSFTSQEVPMIIRQFAALPSAVGNWTNFSAPANTPMIPLASMGAKTIDRSFIWKVNLAMNNQHIGYGPGALLLQVGDNILTEQEQIPYKGKTVPVIWGSDYF